MTESARSRRRSRIAHFKTPFVVAVLAPVAALGAGCGGRAEQTSPSEQGNDQTGSSTSSRDSSTNPGGCPTRAPAVGSACASNELTCSYGGDSCSSDRRCLDGSWQIHAPGCNPPPVWRTACPEEQPEIGSSCAGYEPGLGCDYPFCYATATLARCNETSLVWDPVPVPSCNPPPPELLCPGDMPTHGSDCYSEGQVCSYEGCLGPGSSKATCTFGQWSLNLRPGPACNPPGFITPECPTVEPTPFVACAFDGQQCSYGTCGSFEDPGRTASCSFGVWRQYEVPCLGSADAGVDGGG